MLNLWVQIWGIGNHNHFALQIVGVDSRDKTFSPFRVAITAWKTQCKNSASPQSIPSHFCIQLLFSVRAMLKDDTHGPECWPLQLSTETQPSIFDTCKILGSPWPLRSAENRDWISASWIAKACLKLCLKTTMKNPPLPDQNHDTLASS